jgi:hypothetical protein
VTIALDWPTQLVPIWSDDLADYVAAISSMWTEVEQFAADPENDVVAWQALFDVDIAPFMALPWLAQCVGDRLPVGLDEAGARDWITRSPNWNRGTPGAIVDAVKRVLTGTQAVLLAQRAHLDLSADIDCVAVITYADETPDVQAVENALRRNVPADLIVEYQTQSGATWLTVQAGNTWAQLETKYGPTWGDVRSSHPGFVVWG